jgi:NADP-dependent 3-hydroxy acid dehydrogenase YdfG
VTEPSLAGKVAVVTGASRGIGLAIARALARRGARLALIARDAARLREAAASIGAGVLAIAGDIGDPAAVRDAADRIVAHFGRLDILVNNAGLAGLHRIEDATDAELRAQIDTNLLGLVYWTRAAIPHLRAAGGGEILNVSSTSMKDPYPYMGIYSATKAAVESLSVALRREVKADGIRVTVFRCGPTWTGFGDHWDPDTAQRAFQAWAAGGYAGLAGCMDPDVVGEAVAQVLTLPAQACMEIFELDPTIHAPSAPLVRK